jgi:HK97 family phage major capsid protein
MDLSEFKSLLDEQGNLLKQRFDAIDSKIAKVEQDANAALKRVMRPGGGAPSGEATKGFADRVADALTAEKGALLKHGRVSFDIEWKAATDPVTTAEVGTYSSIPGSVPTFTIGVQQAMARRSIDSATNIVYPRLSGVEGSAALQAEGSGKAQVHPNFDPITQGALTIAAWAKVTRQAMDDYDELRAQIGAALTEAVQRAIDAMLVNGGTGFTGGLNALATDHTSLVYERLADAVSEAQATMLEEGFMPRTVAMRPSSWLGVQLATGGADGLYLAGGYGTGYLDPMPSGLRGLRVALSPAATAGKALLIDPAHVELLDFGSINVIAAMAGNDLTENKVTVLAETRVVPVVRSVKALRLVTPKAA